jgi:multiple sugar transport system substrate-binding protein
MDDPTEGAQTPPRLVLSRREMLRKAAAMGGTLAATILASCGGSTATTQNPTAASTTGAVGDATSATIATVPSAAGNGEPITLRVWGYGLDDARAKARVNTFTQANPNIRIESVGGELNTQQLLTAVASGEPPEIVNVDRVQIGSWAGRNAIEPINDLIDGDSFGVQQFYPFLLNQVTYKDQIYGIPQFVNVDLFFMNLDVLQEVGIDASQIDPGNWEQLTQFGEQLHQRDGDKVVRTGFDTKAQDGRLWLWSWANGVDLISEDGMQAHFNDPKVVEALTWAKETVDRQGGELARAAFSQTQNFFSPENPVLIGQTALTLFEQWLLGVMKVNPQANFQAILPRMRNSQTPLTEGTGQALAIPRGVSVDKRQAAWAFIKGMTSTEAWIAGEQATLADNQANNTPYHPTISGNIKADEEAWNTIFQAFSPPFDAAIKLFPDALAAAKFRYSGPVAADINDHMRSTVNDVLQGVREPQEALDDLQTQAQQAIDTFAAS